MLAYRPDHRSCTYHMYDSKLQVATHASYWTDDFGFGLQSRAFTRKSALSTSSYIRAMKTDGALASAKAQASQRHAFSNVEAGIGNGNENQNSLGRVATRKLTTHIMHFIHVHTYVCTYLPKVRYLHNANASVGSTGMQYVCTCLISCRECSNAT